MRAAPLVALMALIAAACGAAAAPTMVSAVPQSVLDEILADAATRSGLATGQLEVVRAEAVTWGDGSLGCPEPGVMYTQALTDGFWVEIRAGDTVLDYRGTGRDYRFCPPGQGQPPA